MKSEVYSGGYSHSLFLSEENRSKFQLLSAFQLTTEHSVIRLGQRAWFTSLNPERKQTVTVNRTGIMCQSPTFHRMMMRAYLETLVLDAGSSTEAISKMVGRSSICVDGNTHSAGEQHGSIAWLKNPSSQTYVVFAC